MGSTDNTVGISCFFPDQSRLPFAVPRNCTFLEFQQQLQQTIEHGIANHNVMFANFKNLNVRGFTIIQNALPNIQHHVRGNDVVADCVTTQDTVIVYMSPQFPFPIIQQTPTIINSQRSTVVSLQYPTPQTESNNHYLLSNKHASNHQRERIMNGNDDSVIATTPPSSNSSTQWIHMQNGKEQQLSSQTDSNGQIPSSSEEYSSSPNLQHQQSANLNGNVNNNTNDCNDTNNDDNGYITKNTQFLIDSIIDHRFKECDQIFVTNDEIMTSLSQIIGDFVYSQYFQLSIDRIAENLTNRCLMKWGTNGGFRIVDCKMAKDLILRETNYYIALYLRKEGSLSIEQFKEWIASNFPIQTPFINILELYELNDIIEIVDYLPQYMDYQGGIVNMCDVMSEELCEIPYPNIAVGLEISFTEICQRGWSDQLPSSPHKCIELKTLEQSVILDEIMKIVFQYHDIEYKQLLSMIGVHNITKLLITNSNHNVANFMTLIDKFESRLLQNQITYCFINDDQNRTQCYLQSFEKCKKSIEQFIIDTKANDKQLRNLVTDVWEHMREPDFRQILFQTEEWEKILQSKQ